MFFTFKKILLTNIGDWLTDETRSKKKFIILILYPNVYSNCAQLSS